MDLVSYLIFMGLVFMMMGLSFWITLRMLKEIPRRRSLHMQKLGEALGLPVHEGVSLYPRGSIFGRMKSPMVVEGNYKGKAVKVFHVRQGAGNNIRMYAAIQVLGRNPIDMTFSIEKKTWAHAFTKMIGSKQVMFGEREFDKKFVVKSNHPEVLQLVLSDSIRVGLLNLLEELGFDGEIQLEGNKMIYLEVGMINRTRRRKRYEKLVDLMSCLRDEMDIYFKGS